MMPCFSPLQPGLNAMNLSGSTVYSPLWSLPLEDSHSIEGCCFQYRLGKAGCQGGV